MTTVPVAPSSPSIPRVVVDDEAPTDAALFEDEDGTRVLILRPVQSFSNAVTQITHLLPGIHPDRVRFLVRLHLPDAADFETVESTWRRQAAVVPSADLPAPRDRRRTLRTVLVNGILWSVAAMAVAGYMVVDTMDDEKQPYQSKEFQRFVTAGALMCKQIDTAHAQCTDVDGTTMLSSVLTSPDVTLFTFSYGKEQVSMRVFPTEQAARMWAARGGVRKLFKPQVAGRYVFFGTDQDRIESYAELVRGAGKGKGGGSDAASAIPDRVVGLAMGSLNLPKQLERLSPSQDNAVSALLGLPVQKRTRIEVQGPVEVESEQAPANPVHVHPRDLAAALPKLPVEDELAAAITELLDSDEVEPAKPVKPTTTSKAAPAKTPTPAKAAPASAPVTSKPVSRPATAPAPSPSSSAPPPPATQQPTETPTPTPTQTATDGGAVDGVVDGVTDALGDAETAILGP